MKRSKGELVAIAVACIGVLIALRVCSSERAAPSPGAVRAGDGRDQPAEQPIEIRLPAAP